MTLPRPYIPAAIIVAMVILAMTATIASQPGVAFSLLLAYALGLGVPFLLVGMFAQPAARWLNRLAAAAHWINVGFGVLLIALGILIFTGNLSRLANFELLNMVLLNL